MTLAPEDRRELVFSALLAEYEHSRARERRLQETTKALRGLVLRMLQDDAQVGCLTPHSVTLARRALGLPAEKEQRP